MTREEFYTKLKELHDADVEKFKAVYFLDNAIRLGTYCPITYVCYRTTTLEYDNSSFIEAANVIGLDYLDANVIADAADQKNSPSRKDLMKALGLT